MFAVVKLVHGNTVLVVPVKFINQYREKVALNTMVFIFYSPDLEVEPDFSVNYRKEFLPGVEALYKGFIKKICGEYFIYFLIIFFSIYIAKCSRNVQ